MSSRSLSPGFFDPRNYREDDNVNDTFDDERDDGETFDVVVPQNVMESSPLTAMIAWWFASSPGCRCGGGERRSGITKIYTY